MTNIKRARLVIDKNNVITFLFLYLIGILVWDYSIIYQIALVVMFGVVVCLYRGAVFIKRVYLLTSSALFLFFVSHTAMGLSVNNSVSQDYLATMLINLLAAVAIERIINSNECIERIMKIWIGVALFTSVYIIIVDYNGLFSGELGAGVQKLFTGGGYSHNDIALIAAFAIAFLSYFQNGEKKQARFLLILQVYFVAFIILTGARKSLLLAIAGMVVYPLAFGGDRTGADKKFGKIILAGLLVIVSFYAILNIPFFYNIIGYRFAGYFSGLMNGTFTESSAISRNVMKDTAIGLIQAKPLIGWGLNTFRTFPGSYNTWSHINYLELWVSGGLFAVLIYYAFYVYAIVKLYKARQSRLRGLFLTIMLFMILMDCLSITYISRFMGFVYCMVDSFINIEQNKVQSEKGMI